LRYDPGEMARRARIGHEHWRRSGRPWPTRGVPKSAETRRRMSEAALARRSDMSRRASGPKSPKWRLEQAERVRLGISGFRLSRRGAYTDRLGRTHRMRSVWESLLAAWLDRRGYHWDYEPVALSLPDGFAYLPDFRLEGGRFLEVKGYMDATSMRKVTQARAMGHRVLLLNKRALERLGVLQLRRSPKWRAAWMYSTSRRPRRTSTSAGC
jgi:hypothetical protein